MGLLVPEDGADVRWIDELQRGWAEYGWVESADLLLASLGEVSTRSFDAVSASQRAGCYRRGAALVDAVTAVSAKVVLQVISSVARELDLAEPVRRFFTWFLCAIDLPDLRSGHYRVASGPGLTPVGGLQSPWEMYFGPLRARFTVRALLVLTADFQKATCGFSSVSALRETFILAGQMVAAAEHHARDMGIRVYGHHGTDDEAVERVIGTNWARGGVISTVALGERPATSGGEGGR